MESKTHTCNKIFFIIIEVYGQTEKVFSNVHENITKLKKTCQDFIKLNENKQIFVFCLDSLQFQCKLIDMEFDDMKRLWFALNNRMYCEYFKLYRLVIEYMCKEGILNLEKEHLQKNFPLYKDLEPFRQYKMNIIQELHSYIIELLDKIYNYICIKQIEFKKHQETQEKGFNMQNFVATFNDSVLSIKQKYDLFISYFEFFHSMHLKYLRRLLTKICLFENQLNKDIRLDEEVVVSIDNKNTNDTIKGNEVTNNVIRQNLPVLSDVSEDNILLVMTNIENKDNIQDNTSVKNIFKRNVKKIINGFRMLRKSNYNDITKENMSKLLVSSNEMSQITKNIKDDINELTITVNTIMENSIETASNNSAFSNSVVANNSNEAINNVMRNYSTNDKKRDMTVKEFLDNMVSESVQCVENLDINNDETSIQK